MKELLRELCLINGVSGDENAVREVIINKIKDVCDDIQVDNLGNLICFKKGRKLRKKTYDMRSHGRSRLYSKIYKQ